MDNNPDENNNYIVYLLTNNVNNCTYVGITNNPDRRIRQHNGLLKGGAKYTTSRKGEGTWDYYGFILGLNKSLALSIEKKIHIYSKKTAGANPLEKRINCINNILKDMDNFSFTIL